MLKGIVYVNSTVSSLSTLFFAAINTETGHSSYQNNIRSTQLSERLSQSAASYWLVRVLTVTVSDLHDLLSRKKFNSLDGEPLVLMVDTYVMQYQNMLRPNACRRAGCSDGTRFCTRIRGTYAAPVLQ